VHSQFTLNSALSLANYHLQIFHIPHFTLHYREKFRKFPVADFPHYAIRILPSTRELITALHFLILLFIIFINDLVDVCEENSKMYLFADDAKMYCLIKKVEDKDKLQRGIENFIDRTSKWQVSLNTNKCKIF